MSFDTNFVYDKLNTLRDYTAELKQLLTDNTDQVLLTNTGQRHIAERLVQLLVDGMIDINQHFIRELNLEISDDLRGTFIIMGGNSILPKEFAEKISPITGVRNILVHQYEKLDKDMFVTKLRKNFSDFEEYQRHIVEYLKSKGL